MKYSNIIYIALISLSFASCSVEEDTTEELLVDYSGIYEGVLACTQGFEYEIGEEIMIKIEKKNEEEYLLDMGDEIIVEAIKSSDGLTIEKQIIGEGQAFDFFTVKGSLTETEAGFMFEISITESEDGDGECNFEILKL